jgi:hypothetical protein
MADSSFGNWIDDPSWDFVQLGGVFIPGVCTVSRFADGVDVDVQKKRKKEKARLRDNGIAPCAFVIKSELTAADWEQWCKILPAIKPRRPGAVRSPVSIVHPLPNLHGVENVYVKEIEYDEPSARRGMTITIKVGEWFEEEKDTPPQKKKPLAGVHPGYKRPDYFGDPKELADTLYRNQHGGLAPDDTGNVLENSFSPEGNDRFGS